MRFPYISFLSLRNLRNVGDAFFEAMGVIHKKSDLILLMEQNKFIQNWYCINIGQDGTLTFYGTNLNVNEYL